MSYFIILSGSYKDPFTFKDVLYKKITDIFGSYLHIMSAKRVIHKDTDISSNSVQSIAEFDVFSLQGVLDVLAQRSKSKTIEANIKKMKEGQHIELYRTSNVSNLIAYRLTQEEFDFINQIHETKEKLSKVNAEIAKCIPPELIKKQKELEKQLNKLKTGK